MKLSDYKTVVTTEMIEETKKKITDEFIRRFYEFIDDVKKYINGDLAQKDFGWKYGWAFSTVENAQKHIKDTLSNIHSSRRMYIAVSGLSSGRTNDIA